MTPDDVKRFFSDFLDAEKEALFSKYSDADPAYQLKLDALRGFMAPNLGVPGSFNRGPAPPGTNFDHFAPNRAVQKKRQLFKLKKWRSVSGEIYGAYTGSLSGNPSYHTLWFARPFHGRLGVVAECGVCIDCYAVDPDCERCGGVGWERMYGERLDLTSLGSVEWTKKLTPPRGPELADYDKD